MEKVERNRQSAILQSALLSTAIFQKLPPKYVSIRQTSSHDSLRIVSSFCQTCDTLCQM